MSRVPYILHILTQPADSAPCPGADSGTAPTAFGSVECAPPLCAHRSVRIALCASLLENFSLHIALRSGVLGLAGHLIGGWSHRLLRVQHALSPPTPFASNCHVPLPDRVAASARCEAHRCTLAQRGNVATLRQLRAARRRRCQCLLHVGVGISERLGGGYDGHRWRDRRGQLHRHGR